MAWWTTALSAVATGYAETMKFLNGLREKTKTEQIKEDARAVERAEQAGDALDEVQASRRRRREFDELSPDERVRERERNHRTKGGE
ncbi:MAG: hypothetical protein ACR2QH_06895 [Geminicoccaceae bacterium]